MQTVCPDHKTELAMISMFEPNLYAVCLLPKADNLIAENDFGIALQLVEQHAGKVAASDRHITSVSQLLEDLGAKASYALSEIVYNSHLAHMIADAIDLACQAHTLGNVVPKTPEINDISAGAWRRRALNQGRLEPGCLQPEGEGWSGDSCPGDQYGLISHTGETITSGGGNTRLAIKKP
jgi:hypothetical protein